MRVAMIFNGLIRLNDITNQHWLGLIERYKADVFVHTWRESDKIQEVLDLYQPTGYQIDDPIQPDVSRYMDRIYPGVNPHNMLSMWTSVKRGWEMVESHYAKVGYEPDLIIRTRFDLLTSEMILEPDQPLVLPMQPDKLPACFHLSRQFLVQQQDVICYGHMDSIGKYCKTLDNIDYIWDQTTDTQMTSELLLSANLWLQRASYINQVMDLTLVR
jgi:hypothetical protein